MQLLTIASAAALVATATAVSDTTSFNMNATCDASKPHIEVHNRCSYTVHLWSVVKGQGCPSTGGAVIPTGGMYQENYRTDMGTSGTSLKISKTAQCGSDSIVQPEYYIASNNPGYNFNYCDMSYVNCGSGKCPTKDEGYYLKIGNQNGLYMASTVNPAICPIMSCSNAAECAAISYINPNDVQTKTCDPQANMILYLCGGEAPGSEPAAPAPVKSSAPSSVAAPSSVVASPKPKHSSKAAVIPSVSVLGPGMSIPVGTPSANAEAVAAAVVTSAPAPGGNIKTEVVYVTEVVNAKRHQHGHRHQHFRA